jgi:S-adenosylmethionine hydrolase
VRVGTLALPVRRTYADAASGQPLALVGSSGLVEIAVRDGNAARLTRTLAGERVRIRLTGRAELD